MPDRITLSRAKGWRKPEGAVVVARPSIWGNPWGIGTPGTIDLVLGATKTRYHVGDFIDQSFAVALFGFWLEGRDIPKDYLPEATLTTLGKREMRTHLHARRKLIIANLHDLRGRDLCCWCKPGQPCHADVLLHLANGSRQ